MFQSGGELILADGSKTSAQEFLPKDVEDRSCQEREQDKSEHEGKLEEPVEGDVDDEQQDDRQEQCGDSIEGGIKSQ